ncbi:MAG: asparagine synthase (glutamine-hydrolyzing) [Patescibacteria group bacterium]
MCGIAGIKTRDGSQPPEFLLDNMSSAIAHRGPDGKGIFIGPGIGLVHRRLAIIDLSPAAAQPMADRVGELQLVFNGEVYNYREIRSELEARGIKFRTQSDSEVILEAYRAWGTDCLAKFRGMFALALWDAPRRRLFVARDRIGKKPFFYAFGPKGEFYFASELKALAQVMPLKPDWDAVRLFLGLQYVPAPLTGFAEVKQLLPGTFGLLDDTGWRVQVYNDWHQVPKREWDEAAAAEEFKRIFEQSVKLRLLSADVSVGAFLSGGIDSAATVAYAVRHIDRKFQTFTMGFPGLKMDERAEAKEIVKAFGTDHYEFEAKPQDLSALLDELVLHYDAPYADSSALPLWLLSRETAREIKVVLTGDGGDELFGGYRRYTAYESALRIFAAPLLNVLAPPLSYYYGNLFHDPRFERMSETVRALKLRPETAYGELFCGSYFGSTRLNRLCRQDFLERTAASDAVEFVAARMGGEASLEAALQFDLTSYLPDDLNVKMDRASMRFGLEARAPFLDQELVKFALSLPLHFKVANGHKKILLKKALHGVVPDAVLNRPKRGFQVPLADWFRGPLASLLKERCLNPQGALAQIIELKAVEKLIRRNAHGSDHGNRLWMLLTLATWLENHQ